ncbi:helix-turn-helix domain-containing protein [Clostridium estertheticum]|uniref:helix-turn-helix domain-containing protein n=1 Tax=Clostridium estertheticum TaxID=238834 RepID=UPI001C6E7715|nr:helix-turn-helix domain-containing protein [Clostridium estertheticum]MBW9170746.1 helix-turn-helix domain-containing protein [Clostridium estertheticum]WLC74414.1 helix-turn-helix domain-containing protein [Clostridium estertheticum]
MTNYTVIDNTLIIDTDLPDSAYRLYNLMLSMAYGEKDTCYPSIKYLAEKLNKSVKTIGRNLKILKEKGLIISKRRGSISNLYTLVKKTMQVKTDKLVNKLVNKLKSKFAKPKYVKKPSSFCDYEQREYDFDELEKKLLGWD